MASRTMTISRQKVGKGFRYATAERPLHDKDFIEWVTALAIPPAWQKVKISRSKTAKVLAVGVDAAGRQQAIYSPAYRAKQDKLKFDRILRFAEALPSLRRQIDKDLKRKRLGKDKVLACIVKLIDEAYFRVGNERYAAEHQTYGITTMRSKHLDISGSTVTFDFVGKSGKTHHKQIDDKQLSRIIKQLDELPGYDIFRYQDEHANMHDIGSKDVNDYIKTYMGEEFTAKDFRTWGGTLLATTEVLSSEFSTNSKLQQKIVTTIVKNVAKQLGNTPAVARSSYIDPRAIAAVVNNKQLEKVKQAMLTMHPKRYMSVDEQCVLRLLNPAG